MRYKLLGRSGLRVSELCLGTMTFGEDWGWGASNEECRRMFDALWPRAATSSTRPTATPRAPANASSASSSRADRDRLVVATKYTLFNRRDDPNFSGNTART